jgi:hypothetical protein
MQVIENTGDGFLAVGGEGRSVESPVLGVERNLSVRGVGINYCELFSIEAETVPSMAERSPLHATNNEWVSHSLGKIHSALVGDDLRFNVAQYPPGIGMALKPNASQPSKRRTLR